MNVPVVPVSPAITRYNPVIRSPATTSVYALVLRVPGREAPEMGSP